MTRGGSGAPAVRAKAAATRVEAPGRRPQHCTRPERTLSAVTVAAAASSNVWKHVVHRHAQRECHSPGDGKANGRAGPLASLRGRAAASGVRSCLLCHRVLVRLQFGERRSKHAPTRPISHSLWPRSTLRIASSAQRRRSQKDRLDSAMCSVHPTP